MGLELLQDFDGEAFSALLYGAPGIGKTSLATWAPSAIVFNLENGLKGIDLKVRGAFATSQITEYQQVTELMEQLQTSTRFDTAVIDTVSKLERLMIEHVCATYRKDSLASFDFGKGYDLFKGCANKFVNSMDKLKQAGKNIILVAHEHIETINDPERDSYDRFSCALDKRISEAVKANVDHVFYMHQERVKHQSEMDKDKKLTKLRGRILIQTRETGGILAKSRGTKPLYIEVKNDESARGIWENC